jgi:hypothetical protein
MNPRTLLASWFAPLLIHGQNQQTAMMRAAAAKAQGLDPSIYGTPLPGSTVTTTNNVRGGWGWLPAVALGACVAAAGVLGGLQLAPKPSPAPAPVLGGPGATGGALYDEVSQEQQPDGSWKEVGRQRIRVGADGKVEQVQP